MADSKSPTSPQNKHFLLTLYTDALQTLEDDNKSCGSYVRQWLCRFYALARDGNLGFNASAEVAMLEAYWVVFQVPRLAIDVGHVIHSLQGALRNGVRAEWPRTSDSTAAIKEFIFPSQTLLKNTDVERNQREADLPDIVPLLTQQLSPMDAAIVLGECALRLLKSNSSLHLKSIADAFSHFRVQVHAELSKRGLDLANWVYVSRDQKFTLNTRPKTIVLTYHDRLQTFRGEVLEEQILLSGAVVAALAEPTLLVVVDPQESQSWHLSCPDADIVKLWFDLIIERIRRHTQPQEVVRWAKPRQGILLMTGKKGRPSPCYFRLDSEAFMIGLQDPKYIPYTTKVSIMPENKSALNDQFDTHFILVYGETLQICGPAWLKACLTSAFGAKNKTTPITHVLRSTDFLKTLGGVEPEQQKTLFCNLLNESKELSHIEFIADFIVPGLSLETCKAFKNDGMMNSRLTLAFGARYSFLKDKMEVEQFEEKSIPALETAYDRVLRGYGRDMATFGACIQEAFLSRAKAMQQISAFCQSLLRATKDYNVELAAFAPSVRAELLYRQRLMVKGVSREQDDCMDCTLKEQALPDTCAMIMNRALEDGSLDNGRRDTLLKTMFISMMNGREFHVFLSLLTRKSCDWIKAQQREKALPAMSLMDLQVFVDHYSQIPSGGSSGDSSSGGSSGCGSSSVSSGSNTSNALFPEFWQFASTNSNFELEKLFSSNLDSRLLFLSAMSMCTQQPLLVRVGVEDTEAAALMHCLLSLIQPSNAVPILVVRDLSEFENYSGAFVALQSTGDSSGAEGKLKNLRATWTLNPWEQTFVFCDFTEPCAYIPLKHLSWLDSPHSHLFGERPADVASWRQECMQIFQAPQGSAEEQREEKSRRGLASWWAARKRTTGVASQ